MVCTVKDKQLPAYDISHLSGVERLSPEEREVATGLGVQYIAGLRDLARQEAGG